MQLAMAALSKAYKLSENVINSMLDLIMGEVLVYFGLHSSQTPQLEGNRDEFAPPKVELMI